jgi:hypothetical protein
MEAERDGKSNDQQQLLQLDQHPQSQRRQPEDMPHVQLLPPQPNLPQPCSRSHSAARRNVVFRRRRPGCHDQVELVGVQELEGQIMLDVKSEDVIDASDYYAYAL